MASVESEGFSVLTVPGLGNSEDGHWQTEWEQLLPGAARADLGDWDDPDPDIWAERLDFAIRLAKRPVIVVAHSLGCHAFVRWAGRHGEESPVRAALLVAPPDCERPGALKSIRRFAHTGVSRLRFPAIVVGSPDDNWASIEAERGLARRWGADFVDAGRIGHINVASRIGLWPAGLRLLEGLAVTVGLGGMRHAVRAAVSPKPSAAAV